MGGMMGAMGSMMGAQAQAKGDEFQAKQNEEQYFQGMIKSFQTDTNMTNHLTATISNIEAVRAASGASINSPSGSAIQNRVEGQGNQDIAIDVSNMQQEASKHLDAMNYYNDAAQSALQAGGIAAAGAIAGGMGGMAKMFG